MESYHDGIFPSLISQGENSSKLFSFLHVFLNVKIYRCLLEESKCCKRASSLVKEIHEFRLPLRQRIRARTSGGGGKVVVGISGYNLITFAFLKNVCQHKERKPDLSGESLCGKVHPLTRKTSKYAFWKELFGRGKDRRQQ